MMYLMFISGIIKMSWMLITGDSIPETTANYVFPSYILVVHWTNVKTERTLYQIR